MPNFIILRRVPLGRTVNGQQLERDWTTPWGRPRPTGAMTLWRPNADVHEQAGEYVVKIELAGMRDAEIEVMVEEAHLIVRGQRAEQRSESVESVLELGISYGPFQLDFALNVPIQEENITARYDDGLLYITLPKRPPQTRAPRRINIQVDESKLTPQ
jgi:HSP20 family protein